jgi:hypothetical protein
MTVMSLQQIERLF